jgi:hypothetical protein
MRKIAFLLLFCKSIFGFTQSGRPDTLFGGQPHAPFLNSIYEADVLTGITQPQTISPTAEKICFDKIMKIKTVTSRGPAEMCLFLNTKIGIVAYTPLKRGAVGVCDIKPDLPDFQLSVIGLKGNTYNYKNAKKKDVIEHYVQTSNSETFQYQFNTIAPPVPLRKKAERRDYCGGKIKAQLYKADGKPSQWFLWGKELPDAVIFQENKYLGNFAVGYANSDKGLFIIMQAINGSMDNKIIELQDADLCFDPSPFKVFEDEQQQRLRESITRERERIARDEAKPEKYSACQNKKDKLINAKKEALVRIEQNMQQVKEGNIMQDMRVQQAQAELYSLDEAIEQMIYDSELKICRAEQIQAERPSSSNEQKLRCLREALASQQDTKRRFEQINTQFRNEPGRQYVEKSKAMVQAIRPCN